MHKLILIGLVGVELGIAQAQDAPTAPNSPPDVEGLRQQVESLTETVKTLQQQVKDQQTTINRLNQNGDANGGTPSAASNPNEGPDKTSPSNSPSPSSSPSKPKKGFPTEDASVVASASTSAPPAAANPGVNANGTAVGGFPTTDSSVVSSAPTETISTTGAGASLPQPMGIGSGKNYMNI